MSSPTPHDADLILKLYDLRREARLRAARKWFAGQFNATTLAEFDQLCPRGSDENASFRMVTGYWEMAASFITNGVLHRDLFYQSGQEMLLVWEKLRRLVPQLRGRSKNPLSYRHLEEVAGGFIDWLNARAPEFYPQYTQTVESMMKPKEEGR